MKRFHLHVSVQDLDESVRFYSTLFAAQPAVRRTDYAKWMLEDPRINFAISTDRQPVGVNHLGFQLDSDSELRGMQAGLWPWIVDRPHNRSGKQSVLRVKKGRCRRTLLRAQGLG